LEEKGRVEGGKRMKEQEREMGKNEGGRKKDGRGVERRRKGAGRGGGGGGRLEEVGRSERKMSLKRKEGWKGGGKEQQQ